MMYAPVAQTQGGIVRAFSILLGPLVLGQLVPGRGQNPVAVSGIAAPHDSSCRCPEEKEKCSVK